MSEETNIEMGECINVFNVPGETFEVTGEDIRKANIFCRDCKEKITSFVDYYTTHKQEEVLSTKLSEKFTGHIGHKVSISFTTHFSNSRDFLKLVDAASKSIRKLIN